MTKRSPRPRLSIRIDLVNGSRVGPGKIALLEAVRAHRSIAAAAREQNMSYRRAWLLIDDMNKAFSKPVVETFPGRSHGAGAALTPFGEHIAARYRDAARLCEEAAQTFLEDVTAATNKAYQADPTTRGRRKARVRVS